MEHGRLDAVTWIRPGAHRLGKQVDLMMRQVQGDTSVRPKAGAINARHRDEADCGISRAIARQSAWGAGYSFTRISNDRRVR